MSPPPQFLDAPPQLLDLPRHLVWLDRPQHGAGQVHQAVADACVHLATPHLVGRGGQERLDVLDGVQADVCRTRGEHGRRLAAPLATSTPTGGAGLGVRRVVEDAVRLAGQGDRLAAVAAGGSRLTLTPLGHGRSPVPRLAR
jgi:hypothetical protein